MVHRISIETGCARASGGPSTSQPSGVDLHQITFYFQAWHIENHTVSESAVGNRKMAEFVHDNLTEISAERWSVTTSPPLRPKPSLAAPVSIRVKRRPRTGVQHPKSATEGDKAAMVLDFVRFRDQEYPKLARSYFHDHLRQRIDFHNVFAITTSGKRVEELEKVVVSAKLNMRMAAALGTYGMRAWGDISEGFASQSVGRPATPEAPFKARLFLQRRYSDAWSVVDNEAIKCPDTPDGVKSIDYEDETLVADEDEQQEVQGDEEWEYIGKKEAHEARDEEDVIAKKSTETRTDGLLPNAIRSTLNHISPALPFDIARHILKLSMPFTVKLVSRKLNKLAIFTRRLKIVRLHKLLGRNRTPKRVKFRGPIGASMRLALAGAQWILHQVSKVLRRVGKTLLMQDTH